jgi:hypothetical protein
MDRSQQAVFLTITHRLTTSRLAAVPALPPLTDEYVPDGRTPLDHVEAVYSIAGGNGPRAGSGVGAWGQLDNNRLFMSIDHGLWLAFALSIVAPRDGPGPLVDALGRRAWRKSGDLKGPHKPFGWSAETSRGSPRGQVHLWRPRVDADHRLLAPLSPASSGAVDRAGVRGLSDPYMLEMDQDYNWTHQSNPLCSDYLQDYVRNHGRSGPEPVDLSWEPAACSSGAPGATGPERAPK